MTVHITDIQVGDKFRFRGLTGQADLDRVIQVLGITVGGQLEYTIVVGDGRPKRSSDEPSIFQVQYSDVLTMVDQHIWELVSTSSKL